MPNLIVIRLTPEKPVDANTFTSYLSASGGLKITAYELGYDTANNQPPGPSIGSASYIPIPPAGGWIPDGNNPPDYISLFKPSYPPGVTSGIFQQVDFVPGIPAFNLLEAVATAIIEVPATAKLENIQLVVQGGSLAAPITIDYYVLNLASGTTPDLNTYDPTPSPVKVADLWAQLSANLYISLPALPPANAISLVWGSDGTPPAFDALLTAVKAVLNDDPGPAFNAPTIAPAVAAGGNVITFAAATTGIAAGMTVSGAGIPNGTVVSSLAGGSVTLSQQVSAAIAVGEVITFTANLGGLSAAQCSNIANEIVWSQQTPLPTPPDPIENLYTNPPNDGSLLTSGGSSPSTNQNEGDREQFEAQLKSYYAATNATAVQLVNYVFALSAAVACEQLSLTATEAMVQFPVNPGQPGTAPSSEAEVILTGIGSVAPSGFGVPAAYFYALAISMPASVSAQQRYSRATGDQLQHVLTELSTAVAANTITDTETFVTVAGSIDTAQAARRILALGVPSGSATPLAPLGTVQLLSSLKAASGATLTFASTAGVTSGMAVSGSYIAPGTTVTAVTPLTVTLSAPVLNALFMGSAIVFTPSPYPAGLQPLMQSWLNFPPSVPGVVSSQSYQPGDDDTEFWPAAAAAQPQAFLGLVLSALTQGYVIPAPFNVALGQQIFTYLNKITSPPTVATLAAVTAQQWTALFKLNPTWLPPQPGSTSARIAAFIQAVRNFFSVSAGVPVSSIDIATSANTLGGDVLPFASTAGIAAGWGVSSLIETAAGQPLIPVGTVVTASTPATVTLSNSVAADVPFGTNITFTPNIQAAGGGGLPTLQMPSTNWLQACLTAFNPAFTFGSGIGNVANLKTAAATVFPNDLAAQAWLVDAFTTIDALCTIVTAAGQPVKATLALPPSTGALGFSLVEALYARGFRSAADITSLSAADFQQALIGSVAYDAAGAIYTAASVISPPPVPGSSPASGFAPINPDGSLTNCIPPPCQSPLGPVAYLSEMLRVSESSTCEQPLTPNAATTLATVLANRRGPLGNLLSSCANLETPIPLIDIVNENLESLGAGAPPTGGVVYDTSEDRLAGFVLCQDEPCPPEDMASRCHDPATIFGALPEHSTPASPTTANATVVPQVYNILKSDFSSCCLPYSQALDVSRTYLRHFRSCRFEEMLSFRKCITEFVLDPANEPVGFEDYRRRYPVRIDIAIEYLGITPEEYRLLFQGTPVCPCAGDGDRDGGDATTAAAPPESTTTTPRGGADGLQVWQLYGFASAGDNDSWLDVVVQLPEFLRRTCLTYCEFIALWKSGFVSFGNRADEKAGAFHVCEPCCLDKLALQFADVQPVEQGLLKLAVFIRLWRKLREQCCHGYSFDQLRDICDVLQLFNGAALNPEFIRQLAAFQMLRDEFRMELADAADKPPASAIDADRTLLLSLWANPQPAKWGWAVRQLVQKAGLYACRQFGCERRPPEFENGLATSLDKLSQLAGFDPSSATDNWHASPTHTLRFGEVLAKIYASRFSLKEMFYLFTVDARVHGESPFPMEDSDEALALPLDLPHDQHEDSLWHLRRKLLEAHVADQDIDAWGWRRIASELQTAFGFSDNDVLALGEHFFPRVLDRAGTHVEARSTRFSTSLPLADTAPQTWNTPPDGPFQYDPSTQLLWTTLPLIDAALLSKLEGGHDLATAEQNAVQDLYFQPRALLAKFALLFPDFHAAQTQMIETYSEEERWGYFRRHFALCHRRGRIIAEHLAGHVARATHEPHEHGEVAALLILRNLFADENKLAGNPSPSWENDDGSHPPVTWTPPPNGGAFAALLALAGTGMVGEYSLPGGAVVWRDVSGSLSGFGRERDRHNCPVPTVLPALNATIPPSQSAFVAVHNGLLLKDLSKTWLGGAQGFTVKWSGALLIEHDGSYEFWGGAPAGPQEKPDFDGASNREWSVTLKRGSRTWTLLSHTWPSQEDRRFSSLMLRRGAYEITIELTQPAPSFSSADQVHPQHTGFQLKYAGPDSNNELVEVPQDRLFQLYKDNPLGDGIVSPSAAATAFLGQLYVGSLRDIRRTYQRAFKALLFTYPLMLSAGQRPEDRSELGYMLAHATNFAGSAFYRSGAGFKLHQANFDFNYLPVLDTFFPPAQDQRVQPSPQRIHAMFDWWERLFDYTVMCSDVEHRCERQPWHLFEEAAEKQPADPAYLLRQIDADPSHWLMDLRYYQGQNVKVYPVSSTDLEDERWVIRAWRADRWLRTMQRFFAAKDVRNARPDLWASDDPSALVTGESETGNANLLAFLCSSAFDNGQPRRYEDVRRLNDGLRVRGRDALLAYLCKGSFAMSPRQLSDLLLIDVEAGVCEKATRIQEAITAVQNFVRRARLGLESGWTVNRDFALMWDREFASFEIWQACRRRRLYKENWLEWGEIGKARRVEAFRFLETKLKSAALTAAVPGGLEWWPDEHVPVHPGLEPLQQHEPAELRLLTKPREGLNLIGTPERDARPSWLAAIAPPAPAQSGNLAGSAAAGTAAPSSIEPAAPPAELPLWMEAAIRMGQRFYRVAAAGVPPAAVPFAHHQGAGTGCAGCCDECGCEHPAGIDEYYFWLIDGQYYDNPTLPANVAPSENDDGYQFGFQDDYYDPGQQQAAYWEDPDQLPPLLAWEPLPIVRLAWCRVHNGVFQQPRRSHLGVSLQSGSTADLSFLGRTGDSLFFSVSGAQSPQGYADSEPPGFRYDLATDMALTLPRVAVPANVVPFVGALPAYPYFAYAPPGTHLFPLSPFCPSLAIARWLRTHCRFEAALRWYRLVFDPLQNDCTWIHCQTVDQGTTATSGAGSVEGAGTSAEVATVGADQPAPVGNPQSACCDSTDVSCAQAEQRAILLHFLETLAEWGHAVMRRRNSPEAFQQARVVFDAARMVLGQRPVSIRLRKPAAPATISAFKPEIAPLNPRLLDLYSIVEDQLGLIHGSLSAHRLRNGHTDREMPYFGDSPLREGWRTNAEPCLDDSAWCCPPSPYRFTFLIQKALEYASKVQELGATLLAAFEKGDAEYLAALRAGHERELLTISLEGKKDQWRDADWQIESLQKTKAVSQANLAYYLGLINGGPNGLIDNELQYASLMNSSLSLRGTANVTEAIGEGLRLIPDFVVGAAGFGGSPVAISWLPLGTKLGEMFAAAARIINNSAQIDSENASLDLTEAGWTRRLAEWVHQTQILTIEIQQIERQILGAQRRRDQVLCEINSHLRQMEQSAEVQNFLRDKFSSHELYLFLQREAASLYYQTYDLALHSARHAERAFNLERGHTTRHFLAPCMWDDLHEGLMAGERLSQALRHMEKSYFDENIREYELTKHISLRLSFPLEFLRLRNAGHCEIDIPEWMFDQDFPGHYMRRIRNVTLTIPCVTGPYTGVHCRLTLINSTTRTDPRLVSPAHDCCCPAAVACCGDEKAPAGYSLCSDDPRMVKIYGAREAMATSSGQNDSGLFELSFNDPRYLPFEYMGAVSRWRIELPAENNYFDSSTLTDAVLHLNFTSREGGEMLRSAAMAAARHKLPGDGLAFFDLRHDFPDAWELFRHSLGKESPKRELAFRISRKFLPFLPCDPEIRITKFTLLFETDEMLERSCPEPDGCPCPEAKVPAAHVVQFNACHHDRKREERTFTCHAAREWPGLYTGTIGAGLSPFRKVGDFCDIAFCFSNYSGEIVRAYLFCQYETVEECCSMSRPDPKIAMTNDGLAAHLTPKQSGTRPPASTGSSVIVG